MGNEILALLVALPVMAPAFPRHLADTREHGECLSSLLDEILAMLVELPAAVPVFLRYLANMVERGACLDPLGDPTVVLELLVGRDLGVARRCTVESARLDWLHKCFVWSSVRLIGSVGLTRSEWNVLCFRGLGGHLVRVFLTLVAVVVVPVSVSRRVIIIVEVARSASVPRYSLHGLVCAVSVSHPPPLWPSFDRNRPSGLSLSPDVCRGFCSCS